MYSYYTTPNGGDYAEILYYQHLFKTEPSKKNTKATGIIKALQHLNIPIENSYAFGDGKNDIEMLSTVGCGIAMGNASDEVKKYAHQVTETVHNDGVAFGIEKFVV